MKIKTKRPTFYLKLYPSKQVFKLKQGNIGFDLAAGDTYYPFLVRHNGNYTLDTTPIVTFTDTYSHFKTNTLQTTLMLQAYSLCQIQS